MKKARQINFAFSKQVKFLPFYAYWVRGNVWFLCLEWGGVRFFGEGGGAGVGGWGIQ